MTSWLYTASKAAAGESETLMLARDSGFIWRSFYNSVGNPIACVGQIRAGDEILLGYRHGGAVRLLARFRVGRPDHAISASPVFGAIPSVWTDRFYQHGYADDPRLRVLVGIFVEEYEPIQGELQYANRNALSKLPAMGLAAATPAVQRHVEPAVHLTLEPTSAVPLAMSDGVHVGVDVGGRQEKGFDLCITEWARGELRQVRWKRLPHAKPLRTTPALRALVRNNDLPTVAAATQASASEVAGALWSELRQLGAYPYRFALGLRSQPATPWTVL